MKSKIIFFFLIFISASCSSDYSPKPKGYFHIELPEPVYSELSDYQYFTFSVSNQAYIEDMKTEPVGMKAKNCMGFNLNYSNLNAKIYCSYFRINKQDFPVFMEESKNMIYDREIKAKVVKEIEYSSQEQKVYGFIYEIQGDAISPLQFVISDSVSSFFRGALYFDTHHNRDSVAPVLKYIYEDIKIMMESFRWKQ